MAALMETINLHTADKAEELHKLNLKLDELFEQYLELLDQYQAARAELAKELSSGYFSLAQANFTSTSRQRYGQDYYDERMQASRTVMIGQNDDEVGRFTMSRASAENGTKEGSDLPPDAKDEDERKEKIDPRPVDPISWFGILVPPALRSAQSRFVNAVEGSIPRVATLAKELRTIEIEIGRARKAIKKLDKG